MSNGRVGRPPAAQVAAGKVTTVIEAVALARTPGSHPTPPVDDAGTAGCDIHCAGTPSGRLPAGAHRPVDPDRAAVNHSRPSPS
jgi:hypothetical protein